MLPCSRWPLRATWHIHLPQHSRLDSCGCGQQTADLSSRVDWACPAQSVGHHPVRRCTRAIIVRHALYPLPSLLCRSGITGRAGTCWSLSHQAGRRSSHPCCSRPFRRPGLCAGPAIEAPSRQAAASWQLHRDDASASLSHAAAPAAARLHCRCADRLPCGGEASAVTWGRRRLARKLL